MESTPEFPQGTLAVVSTPIGNPFDITLRALRVLEAADLIAAEDTRTARRLLAAHRISKPLISYHDWNEAQRAGTLLQRIEDGARVAVISEAGTPGISDPGYDVVRLARQRGVRVFPVPGPTAVSAFLSVSGLPTNAFSFFGFPPNRRTQRKAFFRRLDERPETLVFYESPRRILGALKDALESFGDRTCALGREITKPHEEFLFGTIAGIVEELARRPRILGEVCWGAAGAQGKLKPAPAACVEPDAGEVPTDGLSPRSAARVLAARLRIPVKEAYARILAARRGDPKSRR